MAEVPVIGFAAYSGTGKTTLLVKLLGIFRDQNLRVGIIKHAHHTFDIDYPGKDSFELRKAGASQVLIGSARRWALMVETPVPAERPLDTHLSHMDHDNLDIILVEGFKPERIPKIELHRPALGHPLLCRQGPGFIAVATDAALADPVDLPVLDLNQPEQIAAFIVGRFLPRAALMN